MRDVINCIKKYVEITNEDSFIRHWKKLSERLMEGIQGSYSDREENIVKIIENIINSVDHFESPGHRFDIFTNSIFIHGNKSQVEFDYYRKSTQRELGDIIFILSVVYNGRKYFEKITINQVKKLKEDYKWSFNKKDKKGKYPDREQLYLLSRFPTFKGVKNSLITSKEYNLPNNSGCLGTHGFLYNPGDFALISSKELELIIISSKKKSLWLCDLLGFGKKVMVYPCCIFRDTKECINILHVLIPCLTEYLKYFPFVCDLPILGNDCISYNSYDFSKKYLLGHIGELIYAKKLPHNRPVFQFLQDLLNAIRRRAEREHAKNVSNFISSFYSYNYGDNYNYGDSDRSDEGYEEGDYEGGGIGIIHTTVNLGEGE